MDFGDFGFMILHFGIYDFRDLSFLDLLDFDFGHFGFCFLLDFRFW